MKRLLAFSLIFLCVAIAVHAALVFGLRRYHGGGSFDAWNQVMEGRAAADIVILGSSRALINFDCRPIVEVTGYSCFNLGLDGSKINLDLPRFKTYLRHNPAPKLLVQVVGIGDLEFGGLLRLHQYAPYLNEADLYGSLVSQWPTMRYHKYIPLYTFAVYNRQLVTRAAKGLLNIQTPETPWPDHPRINGFLPVDIKWTNEFDQFKKEFPDGENFEISSRAIAAFEELIDICRRQGIAIIFVFPPAYYESVYGYTKNVKAIFQVYGEMTTRHGVPFLDYSRIPMTHEQSYFYNSQHMNATGAAVFSRVFAADLKPLVDNIAASAQRGDL